MSRAIPGFDYRLGAARTLPLQQWRAETRDLRRRCEQGETFFHDPQTGRLGVEVYGYVPELRAIEGGRLA
jgi:hypothetical protein